MRRYALVGLIALTVIISTGFTLLPRGEERVTSDGNVVVTGASRIEVLADGGDAKMTIRTWDTQGDSLVAWPATGDTSYTLLDGIPRVFNEVQLRFVYIDLVGASSVVVTWR